MPFVSRRLDPSTSRRQPDGFRSARGASGLTRAAIRASHGAAPCLPSCRRRVSPRRRRPVAICGCDSVKTGEGNATPKPLNKFLPKVAWSFYICSCTAVPEKTAEPIVDLLNRGVSVVGIAAREDLTAKRSRPEMAPQRLEKIESAPGNGMVPEGSNPQDMVHGRAAGRARLRLKNDKVAVAPRVAHLFLRTIWIGRR
jgi:hypothetical protein